MATLPDGTDTGDLGIEDCVPDVPDVQAAVDKAIATARGKVADIDFRPVDFNMDVSKYFDFEFFGKLLGGSGMSLDVCDHCINGTDFEGIAPDWVPAQETVDGINAGINQNAQDISNINVSPPPNAGGGAFSISLDSAMSFLFSTLVDSAEFDSDGLA